MPRDADRLADDRAVLLLSGGVDSTALLAELHAAGTEVLAITFDYGQRHAGEIASAAFFARAYGVSEHLVVRLDLRLGCGSALLQGGPEPAKFAAAPPPGHVDTYVPMRNLVLIAHAAAVAEARGIGRVVVGFNRDDAANYWDCSSAFLDAVNGLAALSSANRVHVEAPFIAITKAEVVSRARARGVALDRTVSCYAPADGGACGACLACRIREGALGA